LLLFVSFHPCAHSQTDIPVNPNNTWNGENTLAVNPTDSNNLVVAWMKQNLFTVSIAISHSNDGGQTWSEPLLMQHTQLGYTSADPGIIVDENGIFYLSFIDFSPLLTGGAVYVTHSGDKGATWSTPVEVINANTSADLPVDRPWMAIDESNGIHHGRIYLVSKSYFAAPPPHAIWLMYSDDGGATWSSPNQVDAQWKVGLLLNSMGVPTVGSDGALYINYASYDLTASLFPRNVVAKSTDGGATFSHYAIADIVANNLENDTIPQFSWNIAANPLDATNLIASWTDKISNDIDIYYSVSHDAGVTWSAQQRLNDDSYNNGIYQDMSWAAFSSNGIYGALWRDRRDVDTGQWAAYKVYGVISADGGNSFTPNFSLSSDTGGLYPGTAGNDFLGVALNEKNLFGTWTDQRTNLNQLYFNRKNLDAISGVESPVSIFSVEIFPQPAHDYFYLKGIDENSEVKITDMSGKVISDFLSQKKQRISISSFVSGMYLVCVKGKNMSSCTKLIVE